MLCCGCFICSRQLHPLLLQLLSAPRGSVAGSISESISWGERVSVSSWVVCLQTGVCADVPRCVSNSQRVCVSVFVFCVIVCVCVFARERGGASCSCVLRCCPRVRVRVCFCTRMRHFQVFFALTHLCSPSLQPRGIDRYQTSNINIKHQTSHIFTHHIK